MGFPMAYPDLLFPRLLLHLVFLLGFVRRFLCQLFIAVGLEDLLDTDYIPPTATTNSSPIHHPKFRSVTAMLIQQVLPIIRYDDLVRESAGHVAGSECAVCLFEVQAADEVRRLSNCRHVFHKCYLDRWMENDQRTCPLCRAPLLPEEIMNEDAFNGCVWDAAGIPDSYSVVETEDYFGFELAPVMSPELFVAPPVLTVQY